MISPKEEYKFLNTINDISNKSYFELFEKYLVQNKKGFDKLTEIESTDQESHLISLNGGYPIPGMIYTFLYGDPDQIQLKFGQKDFIDVIPMTFCINNDIDSFKGINLNMLPPLTRLDFLESFYNVFKDFFKTEENLTQNNKIALNKRFIEYVKSGKGKDLLKIFNNQNNANFNYGYRSYKIGKVKRLRLIEYSEWIYIPFFMPKEAFRKMNFHQIHKLYNQAQ